MAGSIGRPLPAERVECYIEDGERWAVQALLADGRGGLLRRKGDEALGKTLQRLHKRLKFTPHDTLKLVAAGDALSDAVPAPAAGARVIDDEATNDAAWPQAAFLEITSSGGGGVRGATGGPGGGKKKEKGKGEKPNSPKQHATTQDRKSTAKGPKGHPSNQQQQLHHDAAAGAAVANAASPVTAAAAAMGTTPSPEHTFSASASPSPPDPRPQSSAQRGTDAAAPAAAPTSTTTRVPVVLNPPKIDAASVELSTSRAYVGVPIGVAFALLGPGAAGAGGVEGRHLDQAPLEGHGKDVPGPVGGPDAVDVDITWRVDGAVVARGRLCTPEEAWRTGSTTTAAAEGILSCVLTPYDRERGIRGDPVEVPLGCILRLPEGVYDKQAVWRADGNPGGGSDAAAAAAAFRVGTYNILADQYVQGDDAFPYASAAALDVVYREAVVVADILAMDCDLISLQEVGISCYRRMAMVLEASGYTGWHTPKQANTEGCAVFYRTDRFDVVEKQALALGGDPAVIPFPDDLKSRVLAHAYTRKTFAVVTSVCQYLHLKDVRTGRDFAYVNTHLYYHPKGNHIRALQLCAVCNYIEARGCGDRAVLTGDLNTVRDPWHVPLLTADVDRFGIVCHTLSRGGARQVLYFERDEHDEVFMTAEPYVPLEAAAGKAPPARGQVNHNGNANADGDQKKVDATASSSTKESGDGSGASVAKSTTTGTAGSNTAPAAATAAAENVVRPEHKATSFVAEKTVTEKHERHYERRRRHMQVPKAGGAEAPAPVKVAAELPSVDGVTTPEHVHVHWDELHHHLHPERDLVRCRTIGFNINEGLLVVNGKDEYKTDVGFRSILKLFRRLLDGSDVTFTDGFPSVVIPPMAARLIAGQHVGLSDRDWLYSDDPTLYPPDRLRAELHLPTTWADPNTDIPFSIHSPWFTDMIDYTVYTPAAFACVGKMPRLDLGALRAAVPGLPTEVHPSDHVPIYVDLRAVSDGDGGA